MIYYLSNNFKLSFNPLELPKKEKKSYFVTEMLH